MMAVTTGRAGQQQTLSAKICRRLGSKSSSLPPTTAVSRCTAFRCAARCLTQSASHHSAAVRRAASPAATDERPPAAAARSAGRSGRKDDRGHAPLAVQVGPPQSRRHRRRGSHRSPTEGHRRGDGVPADRGAHVAGHQACRGRGRAGGHPGDTGPGGDRGGPAGRYRERLSRGRPAGGQHHPCPGRGGRLVAQCRGHVDQAGWPDTPRSRPAPRWPGSPKVKAMARTSNSVRHRSEALARAALR